MEDVYRALGAVKGLRIAIFAFAVSYLVYLFTLIGISIQQTPLASFYIKLIALINENAWWAHLLGSGSVLATVLILYVNGRKYIRGLLLLIARPSLGDPEANGHIYSEKDMAQRFIQFSEDAHLLYILAGDGDYLRSGNPQFEQVLRLGSKCKLLINDQHRLEVDDIKALLRAQVKVRVYEESENRVLRGRIKRNASQSSICAYDKTNDRYRLVETSNSVITESLLAKFEEWFDNGKNPLIRYILFDLGNVYLRGDFRTFLDRVKEKFNVDVNLKSSDYLCASEDLNLGKITIVEYIEALVGRALPKKAASEFRELWSTNWGLDQAMKDLASALANDGYVLCVASNCDEGNANIYELKNYLDRFDHNFFSCRIKSVKPNKPFFDHILETLKADPTECILIDDRLENIQAGRDLGMDVIHVPGSVEESRRPEFIKQKFNDRGILLSR
jgi:FMN phosphatase YigB (HAD superfamily)|nr:HAD-IA family hydrolase [Neorhizobium tomejilense]